MDNFASTLTPGEIAAETLRLAARLKGKPRANDVLWGVLNAKRLEYAQRGEWGLYRNATFYMADLLTIDKRFGDATRYMLEVCYWDASLLPPGREEPILDGVAPILSTVVDLAGMKRNQVRRAFMDAVRLVVLQHPRAANPDAAWRSIETALAVK